MSAEALRRAEERRDAVRKRLARGGVVAQKELDKNRRAALSAESAAQAVEFRKRVGVQEKAWTRPSYKKARSAMAAAAPAAWSRSTASSRFSTVDRSSFSSAYSSSLRDEGPTAAGLANLDKNRREEASAENARQAEAFRTRRRVGSSGCSPDRPPCLPRTEDSGPCVSTARVVDPPRSSRERRDCSAIGSVHLAFYRRMLRTLCAAPAPRRRRSGEGGDRRRSSLLLAGCLSAAQVRRVS